MTNLEVVLSLFGFAFLLTSGRLKSITAQRVIISGLLALGLLHFAFDGLRWQMLPAYFALGVIAVQLSSFHKRRSHNKLYLLLGKSFLFILLIISVLLSSLLPIFTLPIPSGAYIPGSRLLHFISDADEPITPEKGDQRALMIKVWYPASIENEEKETYLTAGDKVGFARKYNLPESTFYYLNKIKTNTYKSPKIAEGRFPVLIFSHGQYSMANGYYSMIEEIVSQGFIVLGINHTFESTGVLFPSGKMVLYNHEFEAKYNNEGMAEMIWETMQAYPSAKSLEDKVKLLREPLKDYYAASITRRWSKDIGLVLNAIPKWNENSFLSGHIYLDKIGVIGHSQGGAVAVQSLLEYPGLSAGVNLDGAQWGDLVDTTISQPLLYLKSDWPSSHPDFNEVAYSNIDSKHFYQAKLLGSGHSSFMDIPYIINSRLINEAGTIDRHHASKVSSELVVKFFQKYLLNLDTNIKTMEDKYHDLLFDVQ